jgi:hypothetical protein
LGAGEVYMDLQARHKEACAYRQPCPHTHSHAHTHARTPTCTRLFKRTRALQPTIVSSMPRTSSAHTRRCHCRPSSSVARIARRRWCGSSSRRRASRSSCAPERRPLAPMRGCTAVFVQPVQLLVGTTAHSYDPPHGLRIACVRGVRVHDGAYIRRVNDFDCAIELCDIHPVATAVALETFSVRCSLPARQARSADSGHFRGRACARILFCFRSIRSHTHARAALQIAPSLSHAPLAASR